MAFFGIFKTKRDREIEQFARDINNPNSEINILRNKALQMRNSNNQIESPREGPKISSEGRRLESYELCIPQGVYINTGHVRLEHNIHYSLILRNFANTSCDADVSIDGVSVGVWRIPNSSTIEIERPIDDTGRFTFYALESHQATKIGLSSDDKLGLITVVFIPEKVYSSSVNYSERSEVLYSSRDNSDERGGTGLAGESLQRFGTADSIERDTANAVTIHLRLVCGDNGPRSLRKRNTDVPSFLPK